ncbi:hypothetical protein H112_00269 [Trichophyton rubrum D6]|uniref:Uncharacterized protein n=3 Tax=Trichophyton TaxID=5550 RepID=A0A080WMK3_TRIRC|nr:uncharacterized protein TERG_12683 [Trichophyton rubrum CBS 118892]EZF27789.1 hypothetical protein H100_00270 [Trichophyton rubrum MR850]EZF46821.1 hypothetical protein H102_00268 [Trichophyton rubrum CBS 100081]EZF57478.1 hypothetical protein H103_00268 [Trichophyton rubrum CBS 288.86]EZF68028.1 hypothetical protein H104_00268 [Trichophyton rubrum CBS 289.86]EZF78818.1 hypothetical protein H105_00261 [Trichophyton soudanense CBS 452.61]EZF89378.1 hypothetical protein H110_00271 [Trichophy
MLDSDDTILSISTSYTVYITFPRYGESPALYKTPPISLCTYRAAFRLNCLGWLLIYAGWIQTRLGRWFRSITIWLGVWVSSTATAHLELWRCLPNPCLRPCLVDYGIAR